MRRYKITFCFGSSFCKPDSLELTLPAANESGALNEVYKMFWGRELFVNEIRETQ